MLIKKLDATSFDVFWGNGWNNWARYEYKQGKLNQLSGIKVPTPVFFALKKRFKLD